jgi:hypothetical protein
VKVGGTIPLVVAAMAALTFVSFDLGGAQAQNGEQFELPVLVVNCSSEPSVPPFLGDAPECDAAVGITVFFNGSDGPLGECVTEQSSDGDYGICAEPVPFGTEIEVLQEVPSGYTADENPQTVTVPEEGSGTGELVVGFINIANVVGLPDTGVGPTRNSSTWNISALLGAALAAAWSLYLLRFGGSRKSNAVALLRR